MRLIQHAILWDLQQQLFLGKHIMVKLRSTQLVMSIALLVLAARAVGSTQTQPPPPETLPDMRETKPIVLCVDCDAPFDLPTHKEVLEGLLDNCYVGQLRQALYLQDIINQFESKAHFDNCDFDSATSYITSLLEEVSRHLSKQGKSS